MRILPLCDGHHIDLYESVHELPARRYLHFNAHLVRAGGIGNTPDDINQRFVHLAQLLAAGKTQDAQVALENLHYSFHFALEQFSPLHLAFGVLVAAVDGQPFADYSETALAALVQQLSGWGLTAKMVTSEVEDVKKNCRLS